MCVTGLSTFNQVAHALLAYYNDLWMYNNQWTWISGSNLPNQVGVYGEKGKPSTTNEPGARYAAVGWYDNLREEFWMFGGRTFYGKYVY